MNQEPSLAPDSTVSITDINLTYEPLGKRLTIPELLGTFRTKTNGRKASTLKVLAYLFSEFRAGEASYAAYDKATEVVFYSDPKELHTLATLDTNPLSSSPDIKLRQALGWSQSEEELSSSTDEVTQRLAEYTLLLLKFLSIKKLSKKQPDKVLTISKIEAQRFEQLKVDLAFDSIIRNTRFRTAFRDIRNWLEERIPFLREKANKAYFSQYLDRVIIMHATETSPQYSQVRNLALDYYTSKILELPLKEQGLAFTLWSTKLKEILGRKTTVEPDGIVLTVGTKQKSAVRVVNLPRLGRECGIQQDLTIHDLTQHFNLSTEKLALHTPNGQFIGIGRHWENPPKGITKLEIGTITGSTAVYAYYLPHSSSVS